MIQLIIGITAGIVIDGGVTFGAIQMLKKWNKRTLEEASKEFEKVIEQKGSEIILKAWQETNK